MVACNEQFEMDGKLAVLVWMSVLFSSGVSVPILRFSGAKLCVPWPLHEPEHGEFSLEKLRGGSFG